MAAPADQISQLNAARKLMLRDTNYVEQVVEGILPIVQPGSHVELRRWFADFLAETFASPTIKPAQKEGLSLSVLETLKVTIENPLEDHAVVKSIVQTAASIYPLVVRWIINNPHDRETWERMTAVKSRILRIWDTAVPGVRMCCVKFAQRVVLVQTVGQDADPRRGDPMEVSLSMVPPTHPLIPPRNLEAEASGLLDRLLEVFEPNSPHNGDAVLVDATLNSLSILIRARPHLANKILNAILNFNPLKLANSPMTPKLRVMVKSMEKTTRSLLLHIAKRDPQSPLAGRIQQYVEQTMRQKTMIFDGPSRKRGPELVEGFDSAKRQKLVQAKSSTRAQLKIPPLEPGPHTIAEVFTLTEDKSLHGFDVALFAEDLVVKIGVSILQRIDADTIEQAISGVRERLLAISSAKLQVPAVAELNPNTAILAVEEDEDDYDPEFTPAENEEQILNKLDGATSEPPRKEPEVTLKPFTLPSPLPLTMEETAQVGSGTVERVFGVMKTLGETTSKKANAGLNRLAASAYDRDAWVTMITRIATRARAGLEGADEAVKVEYNAAQQASLSNTIRESILEYVVDDWRKRIDVVVYWLCEEWYNDKIQLKSGQGKPTFNYQRWVLRVLDGILPFLDSKDKFLTRFLSEIPELSAEVIDRVKLLCRDPAMVNLAMISLVYLVVTRPPAKELALDAMEDIWNTYEDARPQALKFLAKYRPESAKQFKAIEDSKIEEAKAAEEPKAVAVEAAEESKAVELEEAEDAKAVEVEAAEDSKAVEVEAAEESKADQHTEATEETKVADEIKAGENMPGEGLNEATFSETRGLEAEMS